MRIYGVPHLIYLFRRFNREYFGGILPMPYFAFRHSVKILGNFTYIPDAARGTTERIEISDFYDYTEDQLTDLMVHEMIHYYLSYTGADVDCTHGRAFTTMANRLNRTYGLNVQQFIDISQISPREDAPFLKKFYYKFCLSFPCLT